MLQRKTVERIFRKAGLLPRLLAGVLEAHALGLQLENAREGLLLGDGVFLRLRTLHDEGITILLVEQNANAALRVADRAYVLETGSLGISGTGEELLNDPSVKEAYLGKARS